MARMLYCRWDGCPFGFFCVAGKVPPTCPTCQREGRWTTTPPELKIPRTPYELTEDDRVFLKVNKIEA